MRSMRKENGFTLIELIATIAIISILSVIAVFTFGKIRESSEDKATELNYKSIMKSAASYANEYYYDEKYWVQNESIDEETFCVPILELSNKGYLKSDDIEDISYNFVLLTRGYSTKALIKEEYDNNNICGGSVNSKSGTLQLVSKSTTNITVKGVCESTGFVNYTYGLFDESNNEIKNYITKDTTYKFTNLNSDSKYYVKVKCNYQNFNNTNYSDGLEVQTGYTNLSYIIKDASKDIGKNKLYKDVIINYESKNIYKEDNTIYYFKVSSNDSISNTNVYECGNDKSPSLVCSSNSTVELKKGYWYKTKNSNNNISIYSNTIVYSKIWDGDRFSTNKSVQITLPNNPYIVFDISHKLYDSYSNSFVGEENNIINYNLDKWMSFPSISWTIYGGYNTESIVYYSNSGNDDDDYINRRSADIDSGYKCNSYSCTFNNIGNNGGMQQIKIEVINKITRDKTIVYINVNIDKKAPILNISNSSGGNWTKDNINAILNYSDTYSGIDKSTIQSKDNKNNKTWTYLSYNENIGDIWYDEGDRVGSYKVCDYADNCIEASTNIKIDRTAPELTIDNPVGNNWTNQNLTVNLKFSDSGSGINASSLKWMDNASQTTWKSLYNTNTSSREETWYGEGNRIGTYEICDNVGNCTTASTPIKIDKTAPLIPTIYNPNGDNWSKGDFKLTLSSSDSYSGIAYYQYTYNLNATNTGSNHDNDWITYSDSAKNSFVTTAFTANRNQPVYVRACDKVGNCSDKNSTNIKIDNIAPSISVTVKNNSASKSLVCNSDECSIDFNVGTWYNKKNAPIISWTISDSNETYTYFYYNSAGNYSSRSKYETKNVISTYEGTTVKSGSYEINSGGKRQVAVTVKDVAGNQTTVVIDFDLDDISPSDPTTFTISNGNIIISGSTDKESGFDHYFYSLWKSGKSYATGNGSNVSLSNFSSVGNYTIYAGAMDKVGNASGSPGRTISVTDKSTSSWYSCDSGTRSGAYCYHYGTVRYATSCKTCSYYSSDCKCASVNRANCPSKCRKSYYKASSCISAGYLWNTEGYCWSYYAYGSSCSACGSTSRSYCDNGYTYSNGSCYYTTGATYHTFSSCSSGYTEYNGKCYKLS